MNLNQTNKKITRTTSNSLANQTNRHCSALVHAQGETLFVDSNVIADLFDRPHRNLMRDLDKLTKNSVVNALNLERITYSDSRGRSQIGWRLSERDALVLMPYLGGKKSAQGQAKLVDEFLRMRKELSRIARVQATAAYQQARIGGKVERRYLTDSVQAMALRAHHRLDSTTQVGVFIRNATETVTRALFLFEKGEKVEGIRERLTAKQLNRLAMAEDVFADAVQDRLDGDMHHHDIYAEAKAATIAFATATGGKVVPGIDRRAAANDYQLEAA